MEKRKRGRHTKNIKPLISQEKGKLAIVGTSRRRPEFFRLFLSDRSSKKHFTRGVQWRIWGEHKKKSSVGMFGMFQLQRVKMDKFVSLEKDGKISSNITLAIS